MEISRVVVSKQKQRKIKLLQLELSQKQPETEQFSPSDSALATKISRLRNKGVDVDLFGLHQHLVSQTPTEEVF